MLIFFILVNGEIEFEYTYPHMGYVLDYKFQTFLLYVSFC